MADLLVNLTRATAKYLYGILPVVISAITLSVLLYGLWIVLHNVFNRIF